MDRPPHGVNHRTFNTPQPEVRPLVDAQVTGTPGKNSKPIKPPLDRQRIVDATDAILISEGYDATTIRRIARELDCAVGSIYRYFADKRDLLNAVTQRRLEPVAMRVELGSPIEKTMLGYVNAAREQPEQYRLMYWLSAVGKLDDSPAVPAVVQRIIDGWAQQVNDENRVWQIWAELHGCVMLGLSTPKIHNIINELSLLTMPLVAEIPPASRGTTSQDRSRMTSFDEQAPGLPERHAIYAETDQLTSDAGRVFAHARTLADGQAALKPFKRALPGETD